MTALVVTRHPGLVTHLRRIGLIADDAGVVSHATPERVRGRNVIGVLPLALAVHAASVTEVPLLGLPAELRGVELSAEQVALYAGEPVTYIVRPARSCARCGDREDPTYPGLGLADAGVAGGLGGCGDLHHWEP